MKPIIPILKLAVCLVGIGAAGKVHANTFSVLKPPPCSNPKSFPEFNFGASFSTARWDLPRRNVYDSSGTNVIYQTIKDNIDYMVAYAMNRWTDTIVFNLNAFHFEEGYDFLYTPSAQYTGWLGERFSNPVPITVTPPPSYYSNYGFLRVLTDYVNTNPAGFNFSGASVCTNKTVMTPTVETKILNSGERVEGFLLGGNDTIYFKLPVSSATEHASVTLQSFSAAPNDIDMYARCGDIPSNQYYDAVARTSDRTEFLDLKSCSRGYWIVAVNSYIGSHWFSILSYAHTSAQHIPVLRAQRHWIDSQDQRSQWAQVLTGAAGLVYGASEGQLLIDQFELYNGNNGCMGQNCGGHYCDICLADWPGNPGGGQCRDACPCSSVDTMNGNASVETKNSTQYDARRTLHHELLHKLFCVDDEYLDYTDPQHPARGCGQSVMDDHTDWAQNNLCVTLNHAKERPANALPWSLPSAWQQAQNHGKVYRMPDMNRTPDNSDFADFNFHGGIGAVVWK